jgi:triosephosphate isomerase
MTGNESCLKLATRGALASKGDGMARRPLIAGNWKRFGRQADLSQIEALIQATGPKPACELLICPPLTLLALATSRFAGGPVAFGGQDVSPGGDGAHTGDIHAAMLADAGARYVIVGHSERRADHGETDAIVRAKAEAALAAGVIPIICVGETLTQRHAGQADSVVAAQLRGSVPESGEVVVAYEPVWAIGTGLTPTRAEIGEMHAHIRRTLVHRDETRLLYGGSVKPGNAAEIFSDPDVDGALVGGCSLKAADFAAIIAAHPASRG